MTPRFLLAARQELTHAVRYYNVQRSGLGNEFATEARATLRRILDFPSAWHRMGGEIRRCQRRRSPHALIYEPQPERGELVIIAVACLHQAPEYWHERT